MPTELRTEPVFDALKQPLALIESDERRKGIETYIEAARTPLERAVHDLMSQMAQAIDEKVGSHYRVRLSYIPSELKDLAQQAASKAGTSANTWFIKALARAVRNIDVQSGPPPPPAPFRDERRPGRG